MQPATYLGASGNKKPWKLDWFVFIYVLFVTSASTRVIWSVCEVSGIPPVLDFMLSRENRAGIKGYGGGGGVDWANLTTLFPPFSHANAPSVPVQGSDGSSKLTPVIHNTEHPSSVWTEAAFVTQAKKFLPNEYITDRSLTSFLTKAA